jgi:putative peptidoglycan lipid II flippase
MVGVIELVASDLWTLVVITLANGRGSTGALVLFNYANQVFSTLYAVLALSIVLSVFPVLAARDGPAFVQASAGSTRAVVLASWLGTALIAAVAVPAAHVLAKQPGQESELIMGLVMFAPGLVGMGVIANLSRVMLAIGRLKVAAVAVAASWLLSMAVMAILAELAPAHLVVGALALGTTIGQIAAAIPLVIITRRIRGPAAVHGVGRATLAGLAAAAAGAMAGGAVSNALHVSHRLLDAGVGAAAACCAIIAFGVVAFLLDDGDLRAGLVRLQQLFTRLRLSRREAG